MRKFKLIKTYPNSPKLGCVVIDVNPNNGATDAYFSENWGELNNKGGFFIARYHKCEENPDFWEEVKEVEKLCVPIGTKFICNLGTEVYTLDRINPNKTSVVITWEDKNQFTYDIKIVNKYFSEGTWRIYVEKPVLFFTEDEVAIYRDSEVWCVRVDIPESNSKDKQWDIYKYDGKWESRSESDSYKWFSTKKLATEYIEENKPIYSKKQVLDFAKYLVSTPVTKHTSMICSTCYIPSEFNLLHGELISHGDEILQKFIEGKT